MQTCIAIIGLCASWIKVLIGQGIPDLCVCYQCLMTTVGVGCTNIMGVVNEAIRALINIPAALGK